MTATREDLLAALRAADTGTGVFRRKEVISIADRLGLTPKDIGWLFTKNNAISRGVYNFSPMMAGVSAMPAPTKMPQPVAEIVSKPVAKTLMQAKLEVTVDNLVPHADPTYVPFGFYKDLIKVLKSENFYPTFISGLS